MKGEGFEKSKFIAFDKAQKVRRRRIWVDRLAAAAMPVLTEIR